MEDRALVLALLDRGVNFVQVDLDDFPHHQLGTENSIESQSSAIEINQNRE
jgi:hypothetical protein